MDKKETKFNDVVVVGKMYSFGSPKTLYCVVKYVDVSSLKAEAGDVLPVYYVSSYYDYKVGDNLLLVDDGSKVSLYYKKKEVKR